MTASRSKRDTATLRHELYDDVAAGRLYLHEAAKRMRAVLGLNQRQFARMLGIAERTYIDFERQAGNPTLETLRRIGCAFGFEVKFGPIQTLHDEGEQARGRCTEAKKPTRRTQPSRSQ